MKFKLPHLKFRTPKGKPAPKRLQATARRAAPSIEDYAGEEPTTRFSTAFVIVLVLHLAAVGGVYAFKSIRASRQADEAVMKGDPAKPAQRPAPSESAEPLLQAAPPVAQTGPLQTAPPAARQYRVKPNDTMQKIAALAGVTAAELADANGIKDTAKLRDGQMLTLPAPKPLAKAAVAKGDAKKADETPQKAASPAVQAKTYVVKKGDTPVAIARNLNVPYDELLKLNKIDDPKKLPIGAVLKLPPAKKKAESVHS